MSVFGKVAVLIEADETGISCTNTFIVSFTSGSKGQLVANHCHDDAVFKITPGEVSEQLVTKEDVDNPDDDLGMGQQQGSAGDAEAGTSIAIGWSANGFVQLPDDYKWYGGGGEEPNFGLGMPETDDGIWASYCDGGKIISDIYVNDAKLAVGARSTLKVETDVGGLKSYDVKGAEGGLGPVYRLRDDPGTGAADANGAG